MIQALGAAFTSSTLWIGEAVETMILISFKCGETPGFAHILGANSATFMR